jgi:hypothetical protein
MEPDECCLAGVNPGPIIPNRDVIVARASRAIECRGEIVLRGPLLVSHNQ